MPQCWQQVARAVRAFSHERGVESRDLIVLLPFAQHLPLARAAWLAQGPATAWLPRLETTDTLARALLPAPPLAPGALSFDGVADRLRCTELLAEQAADWPRRDARSFERAVSQVVEIAQALARARLALPPARRADWLEAARSALGAVMGPGAQERALARLALEWSLTADETVADALHAQRPAGWVALRAGATDALVEALLGHADVPVLWLDGDAREAGSFAARDGAQLAACSDFEHEAQRGAAQVLAHLARGERPVALVALDRVLLRRVRALLERQPLNVADETGWKLSTTRAAATVAGLLRAAHPRATTDELLDWLKSSPRAWPGLDALEAGWRKHAVSALRQVDAAQLAGSALGLWQQWQSIVDLVRPASGARRAPRADGRVRLCAALRHAGVWDALTGDAAGAQVLEALRCRDVGASGAWARQAAASRFDASGFRAWVDGVLEQVAFEPPLVGNDVPAVVITPLARAVLRPFAAIVCPGADELHLGASPPPQPLLGDALAGALGLPTAVERREAERRAFTQLLRTPRLTLLYRERDGAEPLQPSPLVQRLQLLALRAGRPLANAPDARLTQRIEGCVLPRPLPVAPGLVPASLNATAYEALRACPYRFFAESMLALGEAQELDDTLEKRDYGSWLHAVLHDFHARRNPAQPADDAALLSAIAREQQTALARDDADFLPYAVWFEQLAPRYLQWLYGEEARGAAVRDTELPLRADPPALAVLGLRLAGRLDRVDTIRTERGPALRILDYKSSGSAGLRERMRQPLEDTQLAFYAALLANAQGMPPGGLQAAYLALDGREGVSLLTHADAVTNAAHLVGGIAADFSRLHAGAALPALGEGSACTYCRSRGLCRRDHWAAPS